MSTISKSNKRYQVFLSSTYIDLVEERRAVIQSLLKHHCFPVGMELFYANDKGKLDFIKEVIDECDYYVLIIADRYGSVDPKDGKDGLSYTEKEYDYAVEAGLHVFAFIKNFQNNLSSTKMERRSGKRKLLAFRKKVADAGMVEYWSTPDELTHKVTDNLREAINRKPALGWIKATRDEIAKALRGGIPVLGERYANIEESFVSIAAILEKHVEIDGGLDFAAYYSKGQPPIYCINTEALNRTLSKRVIKHADEEHAALYLKVGEAVESLVREQNIVFGSISQGDLCRVVFDVKEGGFFYQYLTPKSYLFCATADQDSMDDGSAEMDSRAIINALRRHL